MTKKILIDEAVVKQVLKKIAKAKELCDKQSKLDRRVVYGNVLIEHFDTICQALEVNNKGVNALAEQSAQQEPVAMTFEEAWGSLRWSEWRMRPPKELFAELYKLTAPTQQDGTTVRTTEIGRKIV